MSPVAPRPPDDPSCLSGCALTRMVVAQYRQACAKGLDNTTALEEAAALLSSIRPAWPRPLIRALAAELVADATRRASPPLDLLIDLATPVLPGDVPPA